jgi:uncharacterized membrane protein YfcA
MMHDLIVWTLFFLVGLVYSSVGHGGASGYLAVLALLDVMKPQSASVTALMLNLVVAGIAGFTYARAGHFRWSLLMPFLIVSMPMAFLGGMMRVGEKTYCLLLAAALVVASLRLLLSPAYKSVETGRLPSYPLAMGAGGLIGWVSGVVGVGGGIFLSPLMILCRWANVKAVAATSAFFSLVNSACGLLGRALHEGIQTGGLLPLSASAGAGGLLGSWLGARAFHALWLRRILAFVLFLACVKLAAKALG